MKLASYKDGSRDGQLVVVSRDLASAHYATGIATRLQQVLDDWNFLSPQLEALSQNLNHGKARHAFAFDPARCLAPLPRAFQWVDGFASADDARPGLRRGASDGFLAPRDGIAGDADGSIDLDAGFAVVVGDVEPGTDADAALDSVRLVMLAASVVGRADAAWFATAFGPVAATPDELAPGWQGGRIGFQLALRRDGQPAVLVPADRGVRHHVGEFVAEAAARRPVAAGSIVGSGPIAGLAGTRVGIDMNGPDGGSLFGAIELHGIRPVAAGPVPTPDGVPPK